MAHSPIFKAPLPIERKLVTSREVNNANKKLRSLTQLLNHENPPDLLPYSSFLRNSMAAFGGLINVPYNQRRRNVVNAGLKCQEILEDVVIRRVTRGEDVNVVMEHWRQIHPLEVNTMMFVIWGFARIAE